MAHERFLSQELDRVAEQAGATCIQLAAIGVEMRSILVGEWHDPAMSAVVLNAHAKRAALSLASLGTMIGQIELLAELGAA